MNTLFDLAETRLFSRSRMEAHETGKPVRLFEKRVLGKLSDPFGKFFPKKKTALSGLSKHASCENKKRSD